MSTPSHPTKPTYSLIGFTSLLLIGGFLFGVAIRQTIHYGADSYFYLAGLIGMMIYYFTAFSLRIWAKRRQRIYRQKMNRQLERRLDRHTRYRPNVRVHAPSQVVPVSARYRQYLAVPSSTQFRR